MQQGPQLIIVCSNDDKGWTWPILRQGQILQLKVLMERCDNNGFLWKLLQYVTWNLTDIVK